MERIAQLFAIEADINGHEPAYRLAIRYSLARWPALCRFATNGRLEMTNNAAERAIRPLALGRKNSYDRCQDVEAKGAPALVLQRPFPFLDSR